MIKLILNDGNKKYYEGEKEMIKGLINRHQLQENKSFIRVLIGEYNYLSNITTPDTKQKEEINGKIAKLHLIDDIMNQAV